MVHRRRTKIRRWVLNHTPTWLLKNNFEILVALICLFAGVPLIFGQVDPASIEATLPPTLIYIWGAILVLGPTAILLGVGGAGYFRDTLEDQMFWERVEAWGLTALAYASYIYAIAIFSSVGFTRGWVASMLVVAFGSTCHLREIDIQLGLTELRTGMGLR